MIISWDVAGFFSQVFIFFFLSSWQLVYIKFPHEYGAPDFDELFKLFHSSYFFCLVVHQRIDWSIGKLVQLFCIAEMSYVHWVAFFYSRTHKFGPDFDTTFMCKW